MEFHTFPDVAWRAMPSGKINQVTVVGYYNLHDKDWVVTSKGRSLLASTLFSSHRAAYQHQQNKLSDRQARLISQKIQLQRFERTLLKEAV